MTRKRGRSAVAASSEPADKLQAPSQTLKQLAKGLSRCHEKHYWDKGYDYVVGVDEAGRGPLAGPVVAAACVLPKDVNLDGLNDSKQLDAEQRTILYEKIMKHPDIIWAVKSVTVEMIDKINILQATMLAMEVAVDGLNLAKGSKIAVLIDGNRLPKKLDPKHSKAIIKGDTKSYAIAAASIIAKVTRDRMMDDLHEQYPNYNFKKHKGYGVPEHLSAIKKNGPCPHHRRTFAPVKHWFPIDDGKKV